MIYFVGIGPGDPELMTVKAVRLVREADAVVFPDTGMGSSAVREILGDLLADKPAYPISIPMRGGREAWLEAHREAAEALKQLARQYEKVVYPVLGDPGVYASSSYLMHLVEQDCPCCVVPGITTMCQAAAELGVPLCEQGERVIIQDRLDPEQPLPEDNVVIMKSGRSLAALKQAAAGREAYAVRNLGRAGEWKGPLAEIPEDAYSYFTTVLVKKR